MGVMLIVIAVLTLLNMARGLVGYFQSADDGGIAAQISVGEFLLVAPEQTLVPAVVGILSGVAPLAYSAVAAGVRFSPSASVRPAF